MLEREKIVAGGHARAAVADDGISGDVSGDRADLFAQFFGLAEQPLRVEIRLIKMIRGAGDVPGLRIDWLVLAAIALGRTRIDEPPGWCIDHGGNRLDVDRHVGTRRPAEFTRAA